MKLSRLHPSHEGTPTPPRLGRLGRLAAALSLFGVAACQGDALQPTAPAIEPNLSASAANTAIVDLGHLGGGTSEAFAISNAGHVVGSSALANGQTRAFLWRNGVMTNLGSLGGPFSTAQAVNVHGHVVGTSMNAQRQIRGTLWRDGRVIDLGAGFLPQGINDVGQIVGIQQVSFMVTRAAIWQNGTLTQLPTLGGPMSQGLAINNQGVVTGRSSNSTGFAKVFRWSNGVMTDLQITGMSPQAGLAINNLGNVAGLTTVMGMTGPQARAFAFFNGQTVVFPNPAGGPEMMALGMNDGGVVVGYLVVPEGARIAWAFVNGQLAGVFAPGSLQTELRSVNNLGMAVGWRGVDGRKVATLWNLPAYFAAPPPPPS